MVFGMVHERGANMYLALLAKRNEVGVQLLSRSLHAQVFGKTSFPAPPPSYVNISKQHLKMHGLDPSQGSVLPDLSFTLPPLQGNNLDEHFHRIGQEASQPWLGLATTLSEADLPPTPHHWAIQSGWTKYVHRQDGADFHESVPYPDESAVVFDVETLPNVSPYAIMAVAATPTAWYAWVSPWLLGETEDVVQLPTLGPSDAHRVVIGHNVSYDRLRLADEYHLSGTKTRFLDTLALHVAVRGMSSHQRPAWMKHRKNKTDAVEQTREAMEGLLWTIGDQLAVEEDPVKRAELERRREELLATTDEEMDTTPLEDAQGEVDGAPAEKWEEITAANSLADVARLHCGIEMDKAVRNDFMVSSREEIRNGLHDYLTYCANDVGVTHSVYQKLLPMFRSACPSPVSFAGALTMGSAFLPVNQEWPKYLERAETTYRVLDEKIKKRLVEMAVDAKNLAEDEKWKGDPWLEQMDWTPKKAGPSRGIISEVSYRADTHI
jgi:DNA polymerase gamma 1